MGLMVVQFHRVVRWFNKTIHESALIQCLAHSKRPVSVNHLLKTHFEIIIDSQEVTEIVQRGTLSLHPVPLTVTSYAAIAHQSQDTCMCGTGPCYDV